MGLLIKFMTEHNHNSLPPAKEGEDYYFNDQGLLVFTKKYHLKRGYCCDNGCRHCPYGFSTPQEKK